MSNICSTREAAQLLGVSLRTIQLWVENGQLPAWKTAGGHRRIPRQAIEQQLAQREAQLSSSVQASRPLRVLVVEDDRDLRRLYELQIEAWDANIEVDFAEDGFQGLLKVGERAPDVLISDLSMPGMDGVQMIQRLRSDPRFAAIRILVVTAHDPQDVNRGGIPAEVPVLTKPVPFDRLREFVLGGRESAATT